MSGRTPVRPVASVDSRLSGPHRLRLQPVGVLAREHQAIARALRRHGDGGDGAAVLHVLERHGGIIDHAVARAVHADAQVDIFVVGRCVVEIEAAQLPDQGAADHQEDA